MTRKPREAPFEQTLAQLEQLVSQLESGDLPLDASLKLFERGIALTRECESALQSARQKVQILLQKDAGASLTEFSVPTAEAPADPADE